MGASQEDIDYIEEDIMMKNEARSAGIGLASRKRAPG
jgi:hypothetical protein